MRKEKDQIELRFRLSLADLIAAINELDKEEREFVIENLLASTSPDYLQSIKEAREEYQKGQVLTHEQVFGKARER